MEQNKRTQIAELGEFGLIDKLTGAFAPRNRTTLRGVGDDAAVIAASRSEATLVSTDLLMEGIDFDLTYFRSNIWATRPSPSARATSWR